MVPPPEAALRELVTVCRNALRAARSSPIPLLNEGKRRAPALTSGMNRALPCGRISFPARLPLEIGFRPAKRKAAFSSAARSEAPRRTALRAAPRAGR